MVRNCENCLYVETCIPAERLNMNNKCSSFIDLDFEINYRLTEMKDEWEEMSYNRLTDNLWNYEEDIEEEFLEI